MTREEWLQARLAEAPPLSEWQIAALRPVLAPVVREMRQPRRKPQKPQPARAAA